VAVVETALPKGARRHERHASFGGFVRSLPFTAPGLVLVTGYLFYPIVRAVYLGFTRYKGFGSPEFVGWDNYVYLFTYDQIFAGALRNTIVWTACAAVLPVLLALPLAVVLNGALRGKTFFRGAFYLPAVLSAIVIGMSWGLIYRADTGILNQALRQVGLGSLAHDWLGDPGTALWAVLVINVWAATGTAMVLLLAGLQSVPSELIEACRIDGGNRWSVFWHVELPTIRPTLALVFLLSVIQGLKSFDLIAATTGGGPGGATQMLSYYSWTVAITNHNYGVGAAIASILLVISILVIVPYVRVTFPRDPS
jgi:raffinose/stachyose/melibiose transport system permease protein